MGLGAVLGSIASRWVCIVSRRGLLLPGGCIAFLGEGCRFSVGVLCFSERRGGALYSVSTLVVNVLSVCGGVSELLGCFAVSVRGVMSCG